MRKYIINICRGILYFIIIYILNGCKEKEGHEFITIVNRGNIPIYMQQRIEGHISYADTFYSCIPFRKIKMEPGEMVKMEPGNLTWEKEFEYIPFIQYFFFSDPYPLEYCNEDSIITYTNKYLIKRYLLTKEDLDRLDWTIIYP